MVQLLGKFFFSVEKERATQRRSLSPFSFLPVLDAIMGRNGAWGGQPFCDHEAIKQRIKAHILLLLESKDGWNMGP